MNPIANTTQNALSVIEDLAMQARTFSEMAAKNMLQLGRVLTEAKPLVAHGEWAKWVRSNAHLSERTAQQYMQAYREFGSDPRYTQLGPSQIIKLLPMTEEERESLLTDNDVQGMSARELDEAIRAQKEKLRAEALEEAREVLEKEREARIAAEKRAEDAENAEPVIPVEFADELRRSKEERDKALAEIERLAEAGREAIDAQNRISAENAKLLREAKEMEADLERQQGDYDRLQKELLDLQSSAAKGEVKSGSLEQLTPDALAGAVRQFMGTCSRLPLMGAFLSKLDSEDRNEIELLIGTVEKWVKDSREALNTLVISGEVVA